MNMRKESMIMKTEWTIKEDIKLIHQFTDSLKNAHTKQEAVIAFLWIVKLASRIEDAIEKGENNE